MAYAEFRSEYKGVPLVVEMPPQIWRDLENMARAALLNETGGAIYTKMIGEQRAVIGHVTPPPADTQATSDLLMLGDEWDRVSPPPEICEQEKWSFVGFWHAHPKASSHNSEGDNEALRALAKGLPGCWPIHIILAADQEGYFSCELYMNVEGLIVSFGEPKVPDEFAD